MRFYGTQIPKNAQQKLGMHELNGLILCKILFIIEAIYWHAFAT